MSNRPIAIGVITNPNSKKNRARKDRADELQMIVGPRGVVRETRTVGEIRPTIEEFLARDVRYWVSDGGDGALHWLVNEARETLAADGRRAAGEARGLPIIVPTNGGTIDFVAKKVGIRGQADEILDRIVRAEKRGESLPLEEVPTFLMTGTRVGDDGREVAFERVGFLTAIAGVGQRFFDEYYLDPVPGPKTVLKIIAKGLASIALNAPVLAQVPGLPPAWRDFAREILRPQTATVKLDGRELAGRDWRALHVGSIYCNIGGIVRMFPFAGDGKLHIMAGNPSMLRVALGVWKIFVGRPIGLGVIDLPVTSIEVEAPEGGELLNPNIDGEPFRGIKRLKLEPGPRVRIPKIDCHA